MKQFFKFVFASIIGILFSVFILAIILISIAGLGEKPVKIEPNSILHIQLNQEILDRTTENPFENFDFSTGESKESLGLKKDILDNIKKAKEDKNIAGIHAGMATADEIRKALIDFKTSGKFIYSYSELYSQKAYYLASVSDSVFVYPEGILEFRGLSSEKTFIKGLLEKLEVQPQIIRGKNNKYKSAVEPLILDKMSDANREQTSKYVNSIWNHLVKGISESRKISVEELTQIADSLRIRKGKDAVLYKLADAAIYKDEVLAILKDKVGADDEKKIKFVSLKKYSRAGKQEDEDEEEKGKFKKDKIAVVYAQGDIESGKGDNETIGSERISEAIRKARKDEKVKAVVLRVNSPGGSALASDVIWREVGLTKAVKPVIVSMGDVAASGGYYISCNASAIVAGENTITGSIGVFGVLPNTQKFFNNKLGITFDGVKTNKYSDLGNTSRPLSADEFNIIQEEVDYIYDDFIGKVSTGRNVEKANVDSIGQGRVWSGTDAKEIHLIDEFGGIERAIELAAEKAGTTDYRLTYLPKQGNPVEQILNEIMGGGDEESKIIANALGVNYKYYRQLKQIVKMSGVQARMPYLIEIY